MEAKLRKNKARRSFGRELRTQNIYRKRKTMAASALITSKGPDGLTYKQGRKLL